jgi:hypothetical protein
MPVMNDLEKRQDSVFRSWQKIARLLSGREELNCFFIGGLGIRMLAAAGRREDLKKERLRDHGDIDIYVFDERIIDFLKLFSKSEYDIWHTPIAGFAAHAQGEFHSVSLRDKENDVDIGLFRAVKEGEGRLVTTNLRRVFHPAAIFGAPPVKLNGFALKVLSPEWLYYMSVLASGEKRKDGQLILEAVDFQKFNKMQLAAYETGSDPFSYFKFVNDFDAVLKNAGVLTHL